MRIISHAPAYSMKVVLKETGLTADVLRAWERRYGLPKPHRSAGGHRLYSDYDIETVRWLTARQREGLNISGAVERWREMADAGKDPLEEQSGPVPQSPAAGRSQIDRIRQEWLHAGLNFDEPRAEAALNQAFALYPVETVCLDILRAGLSEIGERWHRNDVSVQQEHFISALAVRRVQTLITASPGPTRRQMVLLGCPPGEWHTFPVLLLYLFLRRRGLEVVYLGADVPIERLEETATAIRPDLVVLAAQQLTTAAALKQAALVFAGKGVPFAFGGLVFNRIPQLHEYLPAYFLGERLADGVEVIERLLQAPAPFAGAARSRPAMQDAAVRLRDLQPNLANRMLLQVQQRGIRIDNLEVIHAYLGDRLAAALEFGNPALIEIEMEWVKQLMASRQIPEQALTPFLAAYRDLIAEEMGETGVPITDWIGAYLGRNGEAHCSHVDP